MSSIKRSQSLRRPAAPSSAVTTRSATRAAATTTTTTTTTTTSSTPRAADSRPQSRTSSPTVPSTRPYSRTISAASNANSPSRSTSARPLTRSLSSASVGRPPAPTTTTATTAMRQAAATGVKEPPPRKESSRYPPSTTLTRPLVTPRPRSSTGMASTALPSVTKLPTQPSRPRSSATNTPSTSAIRPPALPGRQPGSSIPGGAAAATATAKTADTGAASPAAAAQRRIISVAKSVTTTHHPPRPPPATATATATVTVTATNTAPSAPTPPSTSHPRIRPGFPAVQRHYSPVRSPGPKLSPANSLTPLATPPPPRPSSKSPVPPPPPAEIGKLQAELLQLYLLHGEAVAADEQWKASAKTKLGERFLKLRDENHDATQRERASAERANVLALGRWGAGGGLDERIQSLEAIITGVWSLSDPGGRYARVVRRFEHWIDSVTDIHEARRRVDGALPVLQAQDALFVAELDEAWKEEREALLQRLSGWKTQLGEIDDLPLDHDHDHHSDMDAGGTPSGLRRMLEGSRSLIDDMLAELHMMSQIEQEAIEKEEEWIQRMNNQEEYHDYEGPRAGAAWRNL